MKRINKKAQIWGMDLMVAFVIFTIGILLFYFYTLSISSETEEKSSSLFYDAEFISSSILSEGYPIDWVSGNVVKIGILSDSKINETKVQRFYALASADYQKTRGLFHSVNHYYVLFSEPIGEESLSGIGHPNFDLDNLEALNAKDLIKLTRYTIYNQKSISMNIYIWK